jgi:hypothetical protein
MKLAKLFLALFVITAILSQAQAAEIRGDEAKYLYRLIERTGSKQGKLQILGFVTERNDPAIKYTSGNFGPELGQMITVSSSHQELADAVRILELAGVKLRIYSGGTTYHEYLATVACQTVSLCVVENFTPENNQ